MFRPIRRKTKERGTDVAASLLHSCRRGVLAVNGDEGYPYAIPINFLFVEKSNRIYFHGAKVGHKADAIREDSRVCFTVYGNETIRNESWAPYVQSVVIFGKCRMLPTDEAGLSILKLLAMKYYPTEEIVNLEIAFCGKAVQLYEIEIEHLSAKEIQER